MTMKKPFSFLACATLGLVLGMAATTAAADRLGNLDALTDREFRYASEAIGAAMSYKPLAPPEPQGLTGFDIGVSLTSSSPSYKGAAALEKANANLYLDDAMQSYRLDIHKGLPFDVDVGAYFANMPGLGIDVRGLEARYALLSGDFATPTISLRGGYTYAVNSDDLYINTRSLDVSVSKGFAMLTPYAGVGYVWVDSDGRRAANHLQSSPELNKYYAGINMGLGLLNLAFETDITGDTVSWGMKLGLRW
ncbi:hypothetical protein DW355_14080 [Hylemonella gracilis]|uniref:Outer membrane protein beta-barrel domain-containing protein n=2 Tax=Hylemonella gracilis TaxID=80880 RepID=A0A4P6UPT7_9BURK|nr:hypothetical protein DW355_14080 [Hylemonella gracilis]